MDDSATEARFGLHDTVMQNRLRGAPSNRPGPPYHVRDVSMIYLLCRFDPAEVRKIVPPDLTPNSSGWGSIAIYSSSAGWGLSPFSAYFMGLELEGVDSPDGSPGMYKHSGFFSDAAGEILPRDYNANFRRGWSRHRREGDRLLGEAGVGDAVLVRLSGHLDPPRPPDMLTGLSSYVGRLPGGGYSRYSVAFASTFAHLAEPQVEFLAGAEGCIHPIRPLEYVWPVTTQGMAMTFSQPNPLRDRMAIDAANRGVEAIDLFARIGRPAAILDSAGSVVRLNTVAEALVAEGALAVTSGRLRPSEHGDHRAFEAMLESTRRGGGHRVSEPVAFPTAGPMLIAQAIAVESGFAGDGKVMVLFDDPTRQSNRDPGPALRLLGLTPAEARIAAAVGAGLSPREAGEKLELTENTVRSTLKVVYDKLGIARQSELAKIVTRLDAVAR